MKDSRLIRIGLFLLLGAAFAFKIFLLFYGYWHRHYAAPPGSDVVVHYQIIKDILASGQIHFAIYPPLFHLIVIFLSKLLHLDPFYILTNWTPVLVLLPSLAMFFLLRQIFSLKVSVLATTVLLFSVGYPIFAFVDGNYPDMLAYGVFGVFLFAFLIRYFKTGKWLNLLWSGLFLVLTGLTHHFTFFNLTAILAIFLLLQFYLALFRARISITKKYLLGLGIILWLAALGYALAATVYSGIFLNSFIRFLSHLFATDNVYIKTPLDFNSYPSLVGNLVWYLGLAGLFYIIASMFFDRTQNKTKQLLIIWFLFFYLMSRLSSSGIPARFGRELALPLVVSSAFLLQYLLDLNPHRTRLGQILATGVLGYLLVINSSLYTGPDKIPDTYNDQVWFWPIDQNKIDYLAANVPSNDIVLYDPAANLFFPVKSNNQKEALLLSEVEKNIVARHLNFPKSQVAKSAYDRMILQKLKQYRNITYILNDVQPPGNVNPTVYPLYAGYRENRQVLTDLATRYQIVKSFDDGAVLYKR